MLINKNNKLFLYEVDPLFYYDGSGDGFGDFEGFLQKIEHIKDIGFDGIIFPDLFNQEKTILKPSEVVIFDKYGKLSSFKKIIDWCKNNNIDFFMEINLKDILNSNMNMDAEQAKTIDILIKTVNEDYHGFNWATKERIELLDNIISFWNKNNINNFIFTNFENLYHETNNLDWMVVEQLKKNYAAIKQINPNITVLLKSHKYDHKSINTIFDKHLGQICDYFIDNSYAFLCTDKSNPLDLYCSFNPNELVLKMKKINISSDKCKNYIISFSSNQIGRISSRWINENVLHNESIKTLLLLIHMTPYSSITYYGDEIGTLRTAISNIYDYYDFDYTEKKRELESRGIKEGFFNYSQKFLSPIHSQSIMMWDVSKNGGFSKYEGNLIRKFPINYLQNNVLEQLNKQDSILNFLKLIISFARDKKYRHYFYQIQSFKIQKNFWEKVFVYQIKNNFGNELRILINPLNKSVNKRHKKRNEIIISTYDLKTKSLKKDILFIKPYESFIYVKINNKMVK